MRLRGVFRTPQFAQNFADMIDRLFTQSGRVSGSHILITFDDNRMCITREDIPGNNNPANQSILGNNQNLENYQQNAASSSSSANNIQNSKQILPPVSDLIFCELKTACFFQTYSCVSAQNNRISLVIDTKALKNSLGSRSGWNREFKNSDNNMPKQNNSINLGIDGTKSDSVQAKVEIRLSKDGNSCPALKIIKTDCYNMKSTIILSARVVQDQSQLIFLPDLSGKNREGVTKDIQLLTPLKSMKQLLNGYKNVIGNTNIGSNNRQNFFPATVFKKKKSKQERQKFFSVTNENLFQSTERAVGLPNGVLKLSLMSENNQEQGNIHDLLRLTCGDNGAISDLSTTFRYPRQSNVNLSNNENQNSNDNELNDQSFCLVSLRKLANHVSKLSYLSLDKGENNLENVTLRLNQSFIAIFTLLAGGCGVVTSVNGGLG